MKKKNMMAVLGGMIMSMLALSVTAAEDYPNKTIRLVLPFSAGGGADHNARI